MAKYRYDIYITGIIDAKDEKVALTIAELGFTLNGKLLKDKNKVAVKVTDVTNLFDKLREKVKADGR